MDPWSSSSPSAVKLRDLLLAHFGAGSEMLRVRKSKHAKARQARRFWKAMKKRK